MAFAGTLVSILSYSLYKIYPTIKIHIKIKWLKYSTDKDYKHLNSEFETARAQQEAARS